MKPTLAQIDGYLRWHGVPKLGTLRVPSTSNKHYNTTPPAKVRRKWRVCIMQAGGNPEFVVTLTRYGLTRRDPPRPHYKFVMHYGHDLVMLAAVLDMDEWGSLWEPLSKQLRSK